MKRPVEVFHSNQGIRIYRLPLDLFPGLEGYAHLVIAGDVVALVDVGSGFGDSNDQLESGLSSVRTDFGEQVGWDSLTHVLITHGHIDHLGGLNHVQQRSQARVGIHELDLRVLTHYEERVALLANRLRAYLLEAGVTADKREGIMSLYLFNKHLFTSTAPDFTYEGEGMRIGPLLFHHVPGHCPGQVVIQVEDVLLSGDHILPDISPHQAPECLTLHTGLLHYLDSLQRTRSIADEIRLTLGGHGGPIEDLKGRIAEIEHLHKERLKQVLEITRKPRTIADISDRLFPDVEGYDQLLAIEEAGAHVEYLVMRGYLKIHNLSDLGHISPTPILYRSNETPSGFLPKFDALSKDTVTTPEASSASFRSSEARRK